MKIAFSSKGKEKSDLIDMRFGRCDYFQIHDTEKETFYVVENKGKSAGGGAGISAAQQLLDEEVEAIVTGNLGPNAFLVIQKANIKTYKAENASVESMLEKFKSGTLDFIEEAGKAHQGMNI